MAANKAQKPPDPDYNPTRFDQATDLAGIHPMSNYLQYAVGIPRGLPAENAELGTNCFQRRRIPVSGAQLLDRNCEAV
jgi:hypothetical protein